jgi:hypothetical protein
MRILFHRCTQLSGEFSPGKASAAVQDQDRHVTTPFAAEFLLDLSLKLRI